MKITHTHLSSPEPAPTPAISSASPAEAATVPAAAATPTSRPGLGPQDGGLAASAAAPPAPSAEVLEHRSVLQHIGQDHEADLGAPANSNDHEWRIIGKNFQEVFCTLSRQRKSKEYLLCIIILT